MNTSTAVPMIVSELSRKTAAAATKPVTTMTRGSRSAISAISAHNISTQCLSFSSSSTATATSNDSNAKQPQQQQQKKEETLGTKFSSISFSGAGFLGSYHLGVAACLVEQKHLLGPGEIPSSSSSASSLPILTGVSAGSLVSAGISAGIKPEDGMNIVLTTSRKTKELGGALDVFQPGFSLIDQMELSFTNELYKALNDGDWDLFCKRTLDGQKLRLGLMDKRRFGLRHVTNLHGAMDAYCYVDEYRSIEDVVAVCTLSSYIPGVTGTVAGTADVSNSAVRRSFKLVQEMVKLGFVKDGITGLPLVGDDDDDDDSVGKSEKSDETIKATNFIDGGLADVFPTVDKSTIIVSPMGGNYDYPSISPSVVEEDSSAFRMVEIHPSARIAINKENAKMMVNMIKSSDDSVLEDWFHTGYDCARKFLSDQGMLTVFTAPSKGFDEQQQRQTSNKAGTPNNSIHTN